MKHVVGLVFTLAVLTATIAAIAGWCMNIGSIINLFGSDIGAELVIRLVGIFVFPLGAVAGYF